MQKRIKGYEDYAVTEDGNIISYKENTPLVLSPCKDLGGYYSVQLCKNGNIKRRLIHRLVAESFIKNPNNLPEINHKDGDKSNNSKNNLEWSNRFLNEQHAYDFGLKDYGRSSVRGVTWSSTRNKWVVRFMNKGVRKFYGYFENKIDAENKAKSVMGENNG